MPQFTPADRQTVRDKFEGQSSVESVHHVGDGLLVQYRRNMTQDGHVYTGLAEAYGWYVAVYRFSDGGNHMIAMPFGSGGK